MTVRRFPSKLWPYLVLTALWAWLGSASAAQAEPAEASQSGAVLTGVESQCGTAHAIVVQASPQVTSPELAEFERDDDEARNHCGPALSLEARPVYASRSKQARPWSDTWVARTQRAAHLARGPPHRTA